ncbi:MAG: NAD(P)-dependent oxidoreductase [Planctomycetota bacterium]|jgi:3-hydroxyisobutyrate dehydrogenase
MSDRDTKLRVGFIGMGIMGAPMATNCLKAGFDVTVHNRTAQKTQPLADAGAKVADSPAAAAAAADVVCLCVTADADVLAVVLDQQTGIIAGVKDGVIVVDHSTVSPSVAGQCAEALKAKGAGFLDAPISGGDVGAKAGTLSIMVGGERADFDKALPVLEAMGKTITYCGLSGAGYTVKLCNQILGGAHLVAAAEAILVAKAAGIDLDAMLQAVSSGAAGSWILSNLGPKMAAGDDAPGFFVDYQLKDLKLALTAADELKLDLPSATLSTELFKSASALGHGRDGTQAVFHVLETLAKLD